MQSTKEKVVLILSTVMAIVSLGIIISSGVSYQIELRDERGEATYFDYEYDINETVEVECQFTAALEDRGSYYQNTGHTAKAIFTIIGTNYSLTIQVDRIQSYVTYTGIEMTHISNGTVVEYEIFEGTGFFLNESSDWITEFKLAYSYTYNKCVIYAGGTCDFAQSATVTGGTSSNTYHFAPGPTFPLHPVVTGILVGLIITGGVMVIGILVRARHRPSQALIKPIPSFGTTMTTSSYIPQSTSPTSITTNLNTIICPSCQKINEGKNAFCLHCGFKLK